MEKNNEENSGKKTENVKRIFKLKRTKKMLQHKWKIAKEHIVKWNKNKKNEEKRNVLFEWLLWAKTKVDCEYKIELFEWTQWPYAK